MPRVDGAAGACPQKPQASAISRQAVRGLSDLELLEGVRRGSELHFTELYERYFQRIYNFCYVRLRNHADVEEIVQETFTVVFRSVESYRGQSSLLSWVYGIAKNTVNNHLRRAKAQESRLERVEQDLLQPCSSLANCTPEEQLNLRRYAEAINHQLGSIADWQAEIFVMRHVENLSIREISDRTERSSDAVRSSLYRVKRLLVEAAEPASVQSGR